jgi:hypothetical protein
LCEYNKNYQWSKFQIKRKLKMGSNANLCSAFTCRCKYTNVSYILQQDDGFVSDGMALNTLQADPRTRPWFMHGGERRPERAPRSKKTGRRIARLWPGDDPEVDRITDQLMFIPPKPKGEDISIKVSISVLRSSGLRMSYIYLEQQQKFVAPLILVLAIE